MYELVVDKIVLARSASFQVKTLIPKSICIMPSVNFSFALFLAVFFSAFIHQINGRALPGTSERTSPVLYQSDTTCRLIVLIVVTDDQQANTIRIR